SVIAEVLRQAGLDGDMAEEKRQQDDAPEKDDGIVVPSLAACGLESVEQALIGHRVEKVADSEEGGMVFELSPGEEGFASVDEQGAPPWRKEEVYSASDHPSRGSVG